MTTRKDILDSALKCVNGDRDQQYGSPEDSFRTIAEFWDSYISSRYPEFRMRGMCIDPVDVASMLALLKVARISGGQAKDDNWIDLAGYAACGGEIQSTDNDSIQTVESTNLSDTIAERLG